MKTTTTRIILFLLIVFISITTSAKRPTITVLNIETKGVPLDAQQMGNLVRIELEKLDTFDVTDRYDVVSLVEKNQLNIANCYGKSCLVEVGKVLQSDYMLTGSVELYAQTIITTLRLINIKDETVERTLVKEYLNLPLELQGMTAISVQKMFGRKYDEELHTRLTKKYDFENSINNPDKARLNLQGPRFGYAFIFGEMADRLRASKTNGGFEANPAMFQFGYQFEKQYLNEGNYQALFEFIPMITGVDQQLFIPSVTILNGFRNNKTGWEVAIGPSIGFATYSKMQKVDGAYYTEDELRKMGLSTKNTDDVLNQDGITKVTSALVFGVGKTVKSGKMNIPVNIWGTIPTKEGFRLGISVGYNSKK
jgi:TolB-like protein